MQEQTAAVILAAGQGKRMKSELPKVLHPLAGQPLLQHVITTARSVGARPVVPVIGHGAEAVRTCLTGTDLQFAFQSEQLGTGHALLCAQSALVGFAGNLLLLCGDVPLLTGETLEALLACHRSQGAAATVLTAVIDDPTGYGRIVRDADGVQKIVEEKDATTAERALNEVNTGIYVFQAPGVFDLLREIDNQNAQGEYYLTDIIAAARASGQTVAALALDNPEEALGINDRVQLAEAAAILRSRINRGLMQQGVTLIDPQTTYIDRGVTVGADTTIHPGAHLRGSTSIGRQGLIEPGVVVTDCTIGDRVHLKSGSVLTEAVIGADCAIGPMAHLRPGTELAGQNKLGNFVETKKAVFGEKSQASHLTYIGDATLGRNINVGCGTITCNYDGVNKHRTVIEDNVFVGSDVQFVAPVTIGRGSLIAAGATITRDVPADALAIARVEQTNVDGWAARKRAKQKKNT